jgi:hypothetical protein
MPFPKRHGVTSRGTKVISISTVRTSDLLETLDVMFCKVSFTLNDKMRDLAFAPYHCLEFCSKLDSFGLYTIGYRDANT